MNYLILTHSGCMDGICSALIASLWARRQGEVEIVQCDYGMPFDVERARGKVVLVTDFAFPPDVMLELARNASTFYWLDHHQTNQGLAASLSLFPSNSVVRFDLNRSGAGITWDTLFNGAERPWLVDYVEDRDLWRFRLPMSREVNCFIQSLDKRPEAYEMALALEDVKKQGAAMLQYLAAWAKTTADAARAIKFCGFKDVPIVTCTYSGIADVLEILCGRSPSGVAIAWLQRKDGIFQYSLRSDGREDVSVLAKKFGGGGHHNAAGFQTKTLFPWEQAELPEMERP